MPKGLKGFQKGNDWGPLAHDKALAVKRARHARELKSALWILWSNALYKTPRKLAKWIKKYFDTQDQKKKPYTYSGLKRSLGIWNFSSYEKDELFNKILQTAYQFINEQNETRLYERWNAWDIFVMKALYNWQDKQEININSKTLNIDVKDLKTVNNEDLLELIQN